jgi:hypothetical protein
LELAWVKANEEAKITAKVDLEIEKLKGDVDFDVKATSIRYAGAAKLRDWWKKKSASWTKDLLEASVAERAALNIREVPVFRVGIFGQERRARAGQEKRHQFSMF